MKISARLLTRGYWSSYLLLNAAVNFKCPSSIPPLIALRTKARSSGNSTSSLLGISDDEFLGCLESLWNDVRETALAREGPLEGALWRGGND